MPHVVVSINGKPYRMACDEGEEPRLKELGSRLDAHVSRLKEDFGEMGDQRLTVMAGVMVADELLEAEQTIERLKTELASLKEERKAEQSERRDQNEAAVKSIQDATRTVDGLVDRLKERTS